MGGPIHLELRRECQMWQEDLRAASDIFHMAHLSSDLEIPSASKNFREELLTKPRQPTSNGKAWVAQPLTRHSISRDKYLESLPTCDSRNLSSSGQVSSPQIITFLEGDQITISGRRAVVTPVTEGKTRFPSKSNWTSQSLAQHKREGEARRDQRRQGAEQPAGRKRIGLLKTGSDLFALATRPRI